VSCVLEFSDGWGNRFLGVDLNSYPTIDPKIGGCFFYKGK